jgi:hypothetical protein
MCARDAAGEVRDGGNQCRPHFGSRVSIGPVITARMEAQRRHVVQGTNAAIAQIGLCDGAEIGRDIANSRRADSDEPIRAGGCRL